MPTINTFLRESEKKGREEGTVWISFYVKRDKINMSTGVKVKPKDFNGAKGTVRKSDPEAEDKNLIIENCRAKINGVFVKYRLLGKELTKEKFRRAFRRKEGFESFYDFFEECQRGYTFRTSEKTRKAERYVMEKIRSLWPRLTFDDIDEEFLHEYRAALIKRYENGTNTAAKNLAVLKKYVRAAFKQGYMDEDPFENFRIYKTKPNYTYLTEEELRRLIGKYREGDMDYIEYKSLEVFLLLCFSSMHIGDAKLLEMERVSEDCFVYFRKKLENRKPEPIKVPMSEPLRKIIYNIAGTRRKGRLLERIPEEQTMNRHLKGTARRCGINKEISLKTGRHTYATLYLKRTKDITSLKEILGHTDYRETLIYAHILDEQKFTGAKETFNDFEI